MQIIYKEEGFDLSDDGKQVEDLENRIDNELRIKRLPERVQQIAELIYKGFNYKEIAERLDLTETNVKQIVFRNRLCNF